MLHGMSYLHRRFIITKAYHVGGYDNKKVVSLGQIIRGFFLEEDVFDGEKMIKENSLLDRSVHKCRKNSF